MTQLMTKREAATLIASKEAQDELAFVYLLEYEYKQGRRWVKHSAVFLNSRSRDAEATWVGDLYGAAVRNIAKESRVLRA